MRVLVTGHERSGTSWVGKVLGSTAGAGYVFEPDDASEVPFAARALGHRGTLPVVLDPSGEERALTRLWDAAFGMPVRYVRGQQRLSVALFRRASESQRYLTMRPGAHTVPSVAVAGLVSVPRHLGAPVRHHVVKSLRVPLMLEWIRARWDPMVVVCRRHPLDIVASYLEIGLQPGSGRDAIEWMAPAARALAKTRYGVPEPQGRDPVACLAWRVGFVTAILDDAVRAHPEWCAVEHADLCIDPIAGFRALAQSIGLEWTTANESWIAANDSPGTRYQLKRVAAEQHGRWRIRLTDDEVRTASSVLTQFPAAERYKADLPF
jgi:hypothetical protein